MFKNNEELGQSQDIIWWWISEISSLHREVFGDNAGTNSPTKRGWRVKSKKENVKE